MSQYHPTPEPCAETVPIKVNRVFDSCSDRDCLSNVQIQLDCGSLPSNVTLVKSRCVKVTDICMNIEPVPFNRGFFSIDLTYTFRVEIMAYERTCSSPTLITGTAYAGKSVILYGGESNSKTFFSNGEKIGSSDPCGCCDIINLPTASVQVVEPIALEIKIGTGCNVHAKGESGESASSRTVFMTLGVFSVVELFRPVTIMVPTYEYTIPSKECHTDTESPCAIFDKIRFPAEEFSPSALTGTAPVEPESCGCGYLEEKSDDSTI